MFAIRNEKVKIVRQHKFFCKLFVWLSLCVMLFNPCTVANSFCFHQTYRNN